MQKHPDNHVNHIVDLVFFETPSKIFSWTFLSYIPL